MKTNKKKTVGKQPKKLTLHKETLKDLSAGDKAKALKGGMNFREVRDKPIYTINRTCADCSDRRIKTGIRPLANALATIDRVRPVAFHYTDEYRQSHPSIQDAEYYNVIAQEFREIFPTAVTSSGERLADGSEILQVDTYPAMIHALAAIQELHTKAKCLAEENVGLRTTLAAITKRLSKIEEATASEWRQTAEVS